MAEHAITRISVQTDVSHLEEAHRGVQAALVSYAEDPLPGGVREEALLKALEAREKAATRAGMSILQWKVRGGIVTIAEALRIIEESPGKKSRDPEAPTEDAPEPEVKRPAPRPPAAVVAPPPMASAESLEKLVAWSKGDAPTKKDNLRAIMDRLGKPHPIQTSEEYYYEVDALRRAVDGAPEEWEPLSEDARRALTGLVAARARHIQDEARGDLGQSIVSLDPVFFSLTAYSSQYRPGFVKGLSRRHEPYGDSWLADAKGWWDDLRSMAGYGQSATDSLDGDLNPDRELADLAALTEKNPKRESVTEAIFRCFEAGLSSDDQRLVKLLLPHYNLLNQETKFKALRKAIRDYRDVLEEEEKEAEADKSVLPSDWPHWNLTRGKRAIIVGGDKRDTAMQAYKEVFGFSEVGWEESGEPRRLESLEKKVRSGAVDMIIMLARFTSHAASNVLVPACKDSGTPFILIERGYGVSQVRVALEKVLPRFQGE